MPRNRAAAIVLHEDKVLVMYRKHGREYYTFPGGGIEKGETSEKAVVREIKEETSIDVAVERLAYQLHYDNDDTHYYFLCRYLGGIPAVEPGTNEYAENEQGDNLHIPQWLPVSELHATTLYPLEVRNRLITDAKRGFTDEVGYFELKVPTE